MGICSRKLKNVSKQQQKISKRKCIQSIRILMKYEIFKRYENKYKLTFNVLVFFLGNLAQRFNGTSTTISPSTQTPSSIQSRQSRVMHFEDKTAAFKQVVTKDELVRMQEMRQSPEGYSSSPATRQHHHQIVGRRRPLPLRKGLQLKSWSP